VQSVADSMENSEFTELISDCFFDSEALFVSDYCENLQHLKLTLDIISSASVLSFLSTARNFNKSDNRSEIFEFSQLLSTNYEQYITVSKNNLYQPYILKHPVVYRWGLKLGCKS